MSILIEERNPIMEKANLPVEKAIEPEENASQPQTQEDKMTPSQKSSYKEVLSQPAPHLPARARLAWLQRRRARGLWAQCDACARWRYLPHVLDCHELPPRWYCRMNPDSANADCSIPEAPIRVRDEEDLIHSEYSAGSVVWARMAGWPWWPAMVDDCPDTEQYYWLDGFSDIPTHYNVSFFDSTDVTRGWIASEQLKPYAAYKNTFKPFLKDKKYKARLQAAVDQADAAIKLPFEERLEKCSFLARYKGNINSPKKVTKKELEKQRKYLKRKFRIEFEESEPETEILEPKTKKKNVIILGRQKAKPLALSKSVNNTNGTISESAKNIKKAVEPKELKAIIQMEKIETEPNTEASTDTFKKANSLAVHVGSTTDSALHEETFDNDTSKTYVPENATQESTQFTQDGTVTTNREFQVVIASPSSVHSDDFEY